MIHEKKFFFVTFDPSTIDNKNKNSCFSVWPTTEIANKAYAQKEVVFFKLILSI